MVEALVAESKPANAAYPGTAGSIAFSSDRTPGNCEVYRMNADGFGPLELTDNAAQDRSPAWSPEGNKLSFLRLSGTSNFEIYTMDSDGSDQNNRTNNPLIG